MRSHAIVNHVCGTALCIALCLGSANIASADGQAYTIEARFVQVFANISENGPTERTLSGPDGWLQKIHERLDSTNLVMDGATLSWDPEPNDSRVALLSAPRMTVKPGVLAEISDAQPIQYLTPDGKGTYVLHTYEPATPDDEAGIRLRVKIASGTPEHETISMDLDISCNWVKERKEIPGIQLNIGEPVLAGVKLNATVQTRLGEWSCYRASTDGEGWFYVFIMVSEAPEPVESSSPPASKPLLSSEPSEASTSEAMPEKKEGGFGLKNVEVHGSIRTRAEYRSGGKK